MSDNVTKKHFPILRLPCEIRLQIYAHTLDATTTLDIKPPFVPTKTNKWWLRPYRDYSAPGLMLTNRQMRAEALELYHKFLLDHLAGLQGTIDAIDARKKRTFWIIGDESPRLSPREEALLGCQRDSAQKEIRSVEGELEERKAADGMGSEQ